MASILTNRTLWLSMLALMLLPLVGCSKPAVINGVMPVEIGGRTFELDIVADNDTRNVGLGGRKSMDDDKGMLFSFKDSKIRNFVMRDCYFDIDIIFLDSAGRIVAMHQMIVEEQKKKDESQGQYERRLKKYSSRFNAQYAIELVGGMLDGLDLKDGEHIKLDTEYLQSITQ